MAEHLIQDTTLTGIADKIRSLLGLTGKMSPAQMQTNLTTEQANITAALAALAEKGVEVPEGSNSNALAGLIAVVESGGVKVNEGTYTLAAQTAASDTILIPHGLGEKPYFAAVFFAPDSNFTSPPQSALMCYVIAAEKFRYRVSGSSSVLKVDYNKDTTDDKTDETNIAVYGYKVGMSHTASMPAGTKFYWIAVGGV